MGKSQKVIRILLISLIIGTILEGLTALYKTIRLHSYESYDIDLMDFEPVNCSTSSDGKLVLGGLDPQLIKTLPSKYIDKIYIYFDSLETDMDVLVFYNGIDGIYFDDNNAAAHINPENDIAEIDIHEELNNFRIDFENTDASELTIKKIRLNAGKEEQIRMLWQYFSRARMLWYMLVIFVINIALIRQIQFPVFRKEVAFAKWCTLSFILALSILIGNSLYYDESDKRTYLPVLYQKGKKTDLSDLYSQIETQVTEHLGFRENLVEARSILAYKIMGFSTNKEVELGLNGWLYYKGEDNLSIVDNSYPMKTDDYIKTAKKLKEVKDRIESQEKEFYFLMPCSKVSIYPENLYGYDVETTPVDYLGKALRQYTDVKYLSLKNCLLAEKENCQLYYRTDTHWNHNGVLAGYEYIHGYFQDREIIESEFPKIEMSENSMQGDLERMMGSPFRETFDQFQIVNPKGKQDVNGMQFKRLKEIVEDRGLDIDHCYRFYNNDISGKSVLIFGDSFLDSGIIPLFAENFSEVTFFFTPYILQEAIDYYDPDIVIYEKGERAISRIREYLSESLSVME